MANIKRTIISQQNRHPIKKQTSKGESWKEKTCKGQASKQLQGKASKESQGRESKQFLAVRGDTFEPQ